MSLSLAQEQNTFREYSLPVILAVVLHIIVGFLVIWNWQFVSEVKPYESHAMKASVISTKKPVKKEVKPVEKKQEPVPEPPKEEPKPEVKKEVVLPKAENKPVQQVKTEPKNLTLSL